ncbi:MAG: glycosyltransferase [Cyclobacteriaceae bacterium]|nr:glycosyltransferase [Cyclobacteriaceae bacterium]
MIEEIRNLYLFKGFSVQKKIKVLHLIKSLGRGGAEMLLPETLKLHDQDKFEFHYIYFLPWKNQMVDALEQAGGKVSCQDAHNNIQMIGKINQVKKYVTQHNVSLIHCHLPWAGIVGRMIHRETGIPVVYTEHNKQERYHFATRWMNRVTFNWQTTVVAVSGDVADSIKKSIRTSIPVAEILNGVNTDFFQRNEKAGRLTREQIGIPSDAVVVGTVAVFRFQKRLKEWLDVFHRVAQDNPNLYGIVVGDGPLKRELLEHRSRLNLDQKVVMPGLQIDVKPWYSAMDIFMMTSVFEGLPVALLEAMSMQCAVVTTNAGGIKQVIRNSKDGIVVDTEEWDKLSDAIQQLAVDDIMRKALGEAARLRVLEVFNLQRMVRELEDLYISLI